ncbi:hypothetical protein HK101_010186 [Irineochytrium annulatum]|nr:hypothetical protein HK101_010186 [Irineochytrium annulatum]
MLAVTLLFAGLIPVVVGQSSSASTPLSSATVGLSSPLSTPGPLQRTLFGVYDYQDPDFNQSLGALQDLQAFQNKPYGVIHFFTEWCQAMDPAMFAYYDTIVFDQKLPSIWNEMQSVPFITWQPACFDPKGPTPANFIKDVAQGKHDDFIDAWAKKLMTWISGPDNTNGTADDRRAYIRLGHEMNTNFYPWCPAKNPAISTADYITFFRRTRARFDMLGFTSSQLQWVWCPNNFDTGPVTAEQLYPGNDAADWVCFDAYNGQGFSDPVWLVQPMVKRLNTLTGGMRPIVIAEAGTLIKKDVPQSEGLAAKLGWIQGLYDLAVFQLGISMVLYWNQAEFAVRGYGQPDLVGWGAAVNNATLGLVVADKTNKRLMTDQVFWGQNAGDGSNAKGGSSDDLGTMPPAAGAPHAVDLAPTRSGSSSHLPAAIPLSIDTSMATRTPSKTSPARAKPKESMPFHHPTLLATPDGFVRSYTHRSHHRWSTYYEDKQQWAQRPYATARPKDSASKKAKHKEAPAAVATGEVSLTAPVPEGDIQPTIALAAKAPHAPVPSLTITEEPEDAPAAVDRPPAAVISENVDEDFLLRPENLTLCITVYPYAADKNDELSFVEGLVIRVVRKVVGGWWEGQLDQSVGWFPANHVAPYHHSGAASGRGSGTAGGCGSWGQAGDDADDAIGPFANTVEEIDQLRIRTIHINNQEMMSDTPGSGEPSAGPRSSAGASAEFVAVDVDNEVVLQRRLGIMKMLIEHESSYVNMLMEFSNEFISPLAKESWITVHDRYCMFSNIDEIIDLHGCLLDQLKLMFADQWSLPSLASTFAEFAERFTDVYCQYCSVLPEAVAILSKYRQDVNMNRFLMNTSAASTPPILYLLSFLYKPLQKKHRHVAILKELVATSHPDQPGLSEMRASIGMMKDAYRELESAKMEIENREVVRGIMRRLDSWEGPGLEHYGDLLLEGNMKLHELHRTRERQFYLLEKILVIIRTHKSITTGALRYKLVDRVLMSRMVVQKLSVVAENDETVPLTFTLTYVTEESKTKTLTITAFNPDQLSRWMSLLERQLELNKRDTFPSLPRELQDEILSISSDTPQNATDAPISPTSSKGGKTLKKMLTRWGSRIKRKLNTAKEESGSLHFGIEKHHSLRVRDSLLDGGDGTLFGRGFRRRAQVTRSDPRSEEIATAPPATTPAPLPSPSTAVQPVVLPPLQPIMPPMSTQTGKEPPMRTTSLRTSELSLTSPVSVAGSGPPGSLPPISPILGVSPNLGGTIERRKSMNHPLPPIPADGSEDSGRDSVTDLTSEIELPQRSVEFFTAIAAAAAESGAGGEETVRARTSVPTSSLADSEAISTFFGGERPDITPNNPGHMSTSSIVTLTYSSCDLPEVATPTTTPSAVVVVEAVAEELLSPCPTESELNSASTLAVGPHGLLSSPDGSENSVETVRRKKAELGERLEKTAAMAGEIASPEPKPISPVLLSLDESGFGGLGFNPDEVVISDASTLAADEKLDDVPKVTAEDVRRMADPFQRCGLKAEWRESAGRWVMSTAGKEETAVGKVGVGKKTKRARSLPGRGPREQMPEEDKTFVGQMTLGRSKYRRRKGYTGKSPIDVLVARLALEKKRAQEAAEAAAAAEARAAKAAAAVAVAAEVGSADTSAGAPAVNGAPKEAKEDNTLKRQSIVTKVTADEDARAVSRVTDNEPALAVVSEVNNVTADDHLADMTVSTAKTEAAPEMLRRFASESVHLLPVPLPAPDFKSPARDHDWSFTGSGITEDQELFFSDEDEDGEDDFEDNSMYDDDEDDDASGDDECSAVESRQGRSPGPRPRIKRRPSASELVGAVSGAVKNLFKGQPTRFKSAATDDSDTESRARWNNYARGGEEPTPRDGNTAEDVNGVATGGLVTAVTPEEGKRPRKKASMSDFKEFFKPKRSRHGSRVASVDPSSFTPGSVIGMGSEASPQPVEVQRRHQHRSNHTTSDYGFTSGSEAGVQSRGFSRSSSVAANSICGSDDNGVSSSLTSPRSAGPASGSMMTGAVGSAGVIGKLRFSNEREMVYGLGACLSDRTSVPLAKNEVAPRSPSEPPGDEHAPAKGSMGPQAEVSVTRAPFKAYPLAPSPEAPRPQLRKVASGSLAMGTTGSLGRTRRSSMGGGGRSRHHQTQSYMHPDPATESGGGVAQKVAMTAGERMIYEAMMMRFNGMSTEISDLKNKIRELEERVGPQRE